jgi:hypothetical protein
MVHDLVHPAARSVDLRSVLFFLISLEAFEYQGSNLVDFFEVVRQTVKGMGDRRRSSGPRSSRI